MFTSSQPSLNMSGYYRGGSPSYRAASWGNAANFGRQQGQMAGELYGTQRQNRSNYNVQNQQFLLSQRQNQRNQQDQFFRFGVNALAGLLR